MAGCLLSSPVTWTGWSSLMFIPGTLLSLRRAVPVSPSSRQQKASQRAEKLRQLIEKRRLNCFNYPEPVLPARPYLLGGPRTCSNPKSHVRLPPCPTFPPVLTYALT